MRSSIGSQSTCKCRRLVKTGVRDCWWRIRWGSVSDQLSGWDFCYAKDIASATRKDHVVARAKDVTLHGWPQTVEDPVLQPYFSRKQNFLLTRYVCCWSYVLLFLKCIGNACWMTYNKSIMESVGWSLWQEVFFGGLEWILLLNRESVHVMFVLH